MNLKNTIDNTNKYKNDLKIARNKINDRIISGGVDCKYYKRCAKRNR